MLDIDADNIPDAVESIPNETFPLCKYVDILKVGNATVATADFDVDAIESK